MPKLSKTQIEAMKSASRQTGSFTEDEVALITEAWEVHGIHSRVAIARTLFPDQNEAKITARIGHLGLGKK